MTNINMNNVLKWANRLFYSYIQSLIKINNIVSLLTEIYKENFAINTHLFSDVTFTNTKRYTGKFVLCGKYHAEIKKNVMSDCYCKQ